MKISTVYYNENKKIHQKKNILGNLKFKTGTSHRKKTQ
jgi:hypothetical protein